ncbi:MAG: IS3 family transposase [Myxococcota bacterium]
MSLTTSRGDATVGQLCEAFGISRQAYYAARKAPPRASAERRRPERRGPWVSDATLVEKIRAVVAAFPAWGVRKVWAYLRRLGTVVSRKRVWKRMKALGLCLAPLSERAQPLRRGHVAVPESNRRWATDLTTAWTAQDGTVALVPVIDCGDRVVFDIAVTKSQDSPAVLDPVERSLEEIFGSPRSVPEGLELRDAIVRWLRVYNHVRPHEALGWRTPAEKRAENLGTELNQAA